MFANMIGISCDGLRELLELIGTSDSKSQNILVLDCRSFLAHNDSRIINSINVFYPPFLRRRNGNKPSLEALISDSEIRDRLMMSDFYNVILYEELDLTKESFGLYVARCLQEEAGIKCVNYLEGGFTAFKKQYPMLCTESQQNPPQVYISSIVSKTMRSNSQYIYTWPFKSKPSHSHKPLTPRNALNCENVSTFVLDKDTSEPAQLLPYLYLGSEYHAASRSTLLKLGITAVLNVSHNCPNYFEDLFAYKRIAIKDSKHDDITMVINEALDFIDKIKSTSENNKVFVHCRAGISRSPAMCIAYLIKTKKWPLEEAFSYVKSRRCSISPNFNFMTQLVALAEQVLSNRSAKLV